MRIIGWLSSGNTHIPFSANVFRYHRRHHNQRTSALEKPCLLSSYRLLRRSDSGRRCMSGSPSQLLAGLSACARKDVWPHAACKKWTHFIKHISDATTLKDFEVLLDNSSCNVCVTAWATPKRFVNNLPDASLTVCVVAVAAHCSIGSLATHRLSRSLRFRARFALR